MPGKFPERVTAAMVRVKNGDETLLLRRSAEIHFGNSEELLGIAVMTNPGKFEFRKTPEWEQFKAGAGTSDEFVAEGSPDLTMRVVIQAIKTGYASLGIAPPNGIVRVYNLSNIRQPDSRRAEDEHKKTLRILQDERRHLLEDPVTHSREQFLQECKRSKFVIMGFVDGVFAEKMNNLIIWSEEVKLRRVCAMDSRGRFSHPYRWNIDKHLMRIAVESIKKVLKGEG